MAFLIACPCGQNSFTEARQISHHLQEAHLLQGGTAWMLAAAIVAGRTVSLVDIASLTAIPRKPGAVAAGRRDEAPAAVRARA